MYLKDEFTAWLPIVARDRTPVVYSTLGEFKPNRLPLVTPYARRRDHQGRHHAKPRRGQFGKWARSVWREAGEFLVGAFVPIKEAL